MRSAAARSSRCSASRSPESAAWPSGPMATAARPSWRITISSSSPSSSPASRIRSSSDRSAASTERPSAGEVEVEERLEGRHVGGPLHQRGAQGGPQRRALGHAGQRRRRHGVAHLRGRDADAVAPEQPGELDEVGLHRSV